MNALWADEKNAVGLETTTASQRWWAGTVSENILLQEPPETDEYIPEPPETEEYIDAPAENPTKKKPPACGKSCSVWAVGNTLSFHAIYCGRVLGPKKCAVCSQRRIDDVNTRVSALAGNGPVFLVTTTRKKAERVARNAKKLGGWHLRLPMSEDVDRVAIITSVPGPVQALRGTELGSAEREQVIASLLDITPPGKKFSFSREPTTVEKPTKPAEKAVLVGYANASASHLRKVLLDDGQKLIKSDADSALFRVPSDKQQVVLESLGGQGIRTVLPEEV